MRLVGITPSGTLFTDGWGLVAKVILEMYGKGGYETRNAYRVLRQHPNQLLDTVAKTKEVRTRIEGWERYGCVAPPLAPAHWLLGRTSCISLQSRVAYS